MKKSKSKTKGKLRNDAKKATKPKAKSSNKKAKRRERRKSILRKNLQTTKAKSQRKKRNTKAKRNYSNRVANTKARRKNGKRKPTRRIATKRKSTRAQRLGILKRLKRFTKRKKWNRFSVINTDGTWRNFRNLILPYNVPLEEIINFYPDIEKKFYDNYTKHEIATAESLYIRFQGPASYLDAQGKELFTIDQDNKPLAPSDRWFSVHGNNADEPVNITEALRNINLNVDKQLSSPTSARAANANSSVYVVQEVVISLRNRLKTRTFRETKFSKAFRQQIREINNPKLRRRRRRGK